MNIVVCVKQVAQVYVQNGYDPDTKGIVSKGIVYRINPYDEIAVEEGLRLREKSGKGKVSVITIGPERSEGALRWCLAMGADNAVHVLQEKEEDLCPWQTASVLADSIRRREADLLLFGKKAIDDEMGQVGTFVAELLDFPVVTCVSKILTLDSKKILVQRTLERGNAEEVLCPVPAVLTVDKSLNRPRYPTFPARKAAKAKPLEKILLSRFAALADDKQIETVRLGPPKLRPKKILSPDSSLSAAARINFVMTGGMAQKKGGIVKGDPGQLASGIMDFLKEKQAIGS